MEELIIVELKTILERVALASQQKFYIFHVHFHSAL